MKKPKKANGEGSICLETATKLYRAAITDTNGKRIVKRFKTKQQAAEWLTIIKAEVLQGEYVAPSNITVGVWLIDYIETYCAPTIRRKTLSSYIFTATKIEPLANIEIQKLTAVKVQKFYNSLPSYSSSLKIKIHTLLKRAFNKAHALGMIRNNPMLNVTPPKLTTESIEIYTIDEIQKITAAFDASRYWKKYKLIFTLAIATGMRIGEILALRFRNVGTNYINVESTLVEIGGEISENPPKTKAGRRKITIPVDLAAALRQHTGKIVDINAYVFHTVNQTPYRVSNIRRMWVGIQEEAGISYRHFHCLRHTHATQLLAAGVPLLEVANRLGHAKTSYTINLYGHAIPGYDETIPDKVTEIFFAHS